MPLRQLLSADESIPWKKIEVVEQAVKDLLREKFICESHYTTWLSNVVLIKKYNEK